MAAVAAYRRFVDKWVHPSDAPAPMAEPELASLEDDLGVRFPTAYRAAMIEVGPCSAASWLLGGIVDAHLDMSDLNWFFSPDEVRQALDWRDAGLPHYLVPFACDCGGNVFCFNMLKLGIERDEDSAIWLFDHDFAESQEIAPSFVAWISAFETVPKVADQAGGKNE